MARLVNIKSGAVVEVADEKVERLGAEWKHFEDEKPKRTTRSTKKSDN